MRPLALSLIAPLLLAACTGPGPTQAEAPATPTPTVAVAGRSPSQGQLRPYLPPTNLVVNGGFEQPALGPGAWQVIESIAGWTLTAGPGVEVQRGVAGAPFEGAQHIELDSHAPSSIKQPLATEAGRWYVVHVAYSPRPGVANNAIEVLFEGRPLMRLQGDGSKLGDTQWQEIELCVEARTSAGSIELRDISLPDSLGGYLDDVVVMASRECEPRR